MIFFRLVCAAMVAWAINWVLSRPEAAVLVEEVPEMLVVGPIAGAIVGYFNLAKRQGWGLIVAVVNGLWTGILTIAVAGFFYLTWRIWDSLSHGLIKDFENFLRILGSEAKPLLEVSTDFRLIGVTIATTAVAGVISEILHWCLVRIRRYRGIEEKREVKAAVAKAGGALS